MIELPDSKTLEELVHKYIRVITILVISTLLLPLSAQQSSRGPSTPTERERALKAAQLLRTAPLEPGTKGEREWLIKWLIEVPDVSVALCSGITGDLGKSKSGHPGTILASLMASQAVYAIQHPDAPSNAPAAYLAGVEGALETYKAIRVKDPKFKAPGLDELLQRQEKGELEAAIKERSATKCK